MHKLAAGQDTQNSWPVGITGFGLGVTDQPGAEPPAGTEALAGIPAAPARTTAARRTDIFAASPGILPSRERRRPNAGPTEDTSLARLAASAAGAATAGRLVQNFMVTPMLQSQFAGPWAMLGGGKVASGAVPRPGGDGWGRARLSP